MGFGGQTPTNQLVLQLLAGVDSQTPSENSGCMYEEMDWAIKL